MYLINTSDQGQTIKDKLETTLEINSGFTAMETITNILEGKKTHRKNVLEELTLDDICHLKYVPVTSMGADRNFFKYKNILLDNRRSIVFENIKQYIIVQCNAIKI